MPYPNSHSPVTLRLNLWIRKMARDPAPALQLLNSGMPLPSIANEYGVARGWEETKHLVDWPVSLMEALRHFLIRALEDNLYVVFDWERAKTTSMSIADFGEGMVGVTFKSPLVYPPYTE